MARIFITGSADGLGRAAARGLLAQGHELVVHVRHRQRLDAVDDLALGHATQEWLATSAEPQALVSGGYWHHGRRQQAHGAALKPAFQDELLDRLAAFTGIALPQA